MKKAHEAKHAAAHEAAKNIWKEGKEHKKTNVEHPAKAVGGKGEVKHRKPSTHGKRLAKWKEKVVKAKEAVGTKLSKHAEKIAGRVNKNLQKAIAKHTKHLTREAAKEVKAKIAEKKKALHATVKKIAAKRPVNPNRKPRAAKEHAPAEHHEVAKTGKKRGRPVGSKTKVHHKPAAAHHEAKPKRTNTRKEKVTGAPKTARGRGKRVAAK